MQLMDYYHFPSDLGLPVIKLFITNPAGECRQTIYLMERKFGWGFNLSSALKYLWRVGVKSADTQSDLTKAIQYLTWELESPIRPLSVDTRTTIETAIHMCQDLLSVDTLTVDLLK
jgi:hypothetical protein